MVHSFEYTQKHLLRKVARYQKSTYIRTLETRKTVDIENTYYCGENIFIPLVESALKLRNTVIKLWGLHSVSFTLSVHSERPRLIGGSGVSIAKRNKSENIDRSNQSGTILF